MRRRGRATPVRRRWPVRAPLPAREPVAQFAVRARDDVHEVEAAEHGAGVVVEQNVEAAGARVLFGEERGVPRGEALGGEVGVAPVRHPPGEPLPLGPLELQHRRRMRGGQPLQSRHAATVAAVPGWRHLDYGHLIMGCGGRQIRPVDSEFLSLGRVSAFLGSRTLSTDVG